MKEDVVGLAQLTSGQAIQDAIAEFDGLGRDAFLEKYGFRPARGYFVRVSGRDYDSKAIAAAAHGFQFPELGPLLASEFSGGNATVAKKLEALGFEVIRPGRNPSWASDELILALDLYLRRGLIEPHWVRWRLVLLDSNPGWGGLL